MRPQQLAQDRVVIDRGLDRLVDLQVRRVAVGARQGHRHFEAAVGDRQLAVVDGITVIGVRLQVVEVIVDRVVAQGVEGPRSEVPLRAAVVGIDRIVAGAGVDDDVSAAGVQIVSSPAPPSIDRLALSFWLSYQLAKPMALRPIATSLARSPLQSSTIASVRLSLPSPPSILSVKSSRVAAPLASQLSELTPMSMLSLPTPPVYSKSTLSMRGSPAMSSMSRYLSVIS